MNESILDVRVIINGNDELRQFLERSRARFKELAPKLLLKIMYRTINVTKENWLTDPGRIYSRWYTRPDGTRYRRVLNYPRPKIGVLTGRLRQSFGSTSSDGIREITANGFMIRIGTNVEYAPYVAERKYNFAEKGLIEVRSSGYIEQQIRELLNEITR